MLFESGVSFFRESQTLTGTDSYVASYMPYIYIVYNIHTHNILPHNPHIPQ